jgi:hypothetical protein
LRLSPILIYGCIIDRVAFQTRDGASWYNGMAAPKPADGAPPTGGLSIPHGGLQGYIDDFTNIVGLIFSWVVFLPASIIISGKFFAAIAPSMRVATGIFKIPLYILVLEANKDEVIFGFSTFFLTLVLLGVTGGESAATFISSHFGFEIGQFRTLCLGSGLLTVIWTGALWLLSQLKGPPPIDPAQVSAVLEEIAKK